MRTNASIDLLRTKLIDRGHILPQGCHSDAGFGVLAFHHGEFLVSLMSMDESLINRLNLELEGGEFDLSPSLSVVVDSLTGTKQAFDKSDFDLWVDVVKFLWLLHGAADTIELIESCGFVKWSILNSYQARCDYRDEIVLLAYKKLRAAGMKHRDGALFFADGNASKQIAGSDDLH